MFCHLHTHSHYSALDGLAKLDDLFQRALELGQTSIAITDHGTSAGLYEACVKGKEYGINVLLGVEFYFENDDGKNGHLILIAKDDEGLKNLFKLQGMSNKNFYYKPRINMDMLREVNQGLVCTTACIANQSAKYYSVGEVELALDHLEKLHDIFQDDFYLELQSSTIPEVISNNKWLLTIESYKRIITTDVHYVNHDDYAVHEVLLAIQQQKKMSDKKRWKFDTNDFWLKSEKEIFEVCDYISKEERQEMINNIQEIVDKCTGVSIDKGNYLPRYKGMTDEMEEVAFEAAIGEGYTNKLIPRKELTANFISDVGKEMKVIKETGYCGYFLIVAEYIKWAKENGILVGDGRGSGAGSKVAYAMDITEINPEKYDLLFERFLAPGKEPDFDTDFSDINAVFKHLQDVYGENNVARIANYSKLTCKAAVRKVMGIHGFTMKEIGDIVSYMPDKLHFSFKEAKEESEELQEFFKENEFLNLCVERLENIIGSYSTHAGGVIICEDLCEKLPTHVMSSELDKLIVSFDKKILESLGHYKFDILSLASLTTLKNVTDNVNGIDWFSVDFDDEGVYEMLGEGDTLGVFQLSGQADMVKQQKPKNFNDLVAINALIRPGVCDWKEYLTAREKCNTGQSDALQGYMESTHGLIVYQDQYLQLAQTYAGWDIAFSDKKIRKNKDIVNDAELCQKFINDGIELGYDEVKLKEIWESIEDVVACGYGFNKAHSTSYARLSFQTAYLKKYYPREFYSGYLTTHFDDEKEIAKVQTLLTKSDCKLLPPDINKSSSKFEIAEGGILFPINSIKGVGAAAIKHLEELRPITDLNDLMERRTKTYIKSTTLESLIKSGCFDYTGNKRNELLDIIEYAGEKKQDYDYEKDKLGIYLSESPLDKFDTIDFDSVPNQSKFMTILSMDEVVIRKDKSGKEMAFLTGSNSKNTIKMLVFASIYKNREEDYEKNTIYYVSGKKDKSSLLINEIRKI